jgi:hypothetical protein
MSDSDLSEGDRWRLCPHSRLKRLSSAGPLTDVVVFRVGHKTTPQIERHPRAGSAVAFVTVRCLDCGQPGETWVGSI